MFINNKDIAFFKAEVMDGFEVGPASISSNYTLGGGSTTPIGYGMNVGAKSITLPIAFVCGTTREAYIQKSKLQQELEKDRVEIYDESSNMYYSAVMVGQESEEELMEGVVTAEYSLMGIMHDALVTKIQDKPFVPLGACSGGQDCRINVTVATLESDGTYKVGEVTFKSDYVSIGTKISIDGFEKVVYINGGPSIGSSDLVQFPKLYPGKENFFDCKDTLTIEYFPVYK